MKHKKLFSYIFNKRNKWKMYFCWEALNKTKRSLISKTQKCMKTNFTWEIHEIVFRALQTIFFFWYVCGVGKKGAAKERMWINECVRYGIKLYDAVTISFEGSLYAVIIIMEKFNFHSFSFLLLRLLHLASLQISHQLPTSFKSRSLFYFINFLSILRTAKTFSLHREKNFC